MRNYVYVVTTEYGGIVGVWDFAPTDELRQSAYEDYSDRAVTMKETLEDTHVGIYPLRTKSSSYMSDESFGELVEALNQVVEHIKSR